MPEYPEQVLPQQWIRAHLGVEEVRAEVPVEEEQEQGHRDYRYGEQQQELDDQDHPGEHGHPEQGHAGSPHVEHRHDQVHGRHQGGDAGDLEAQGVEVHSVAGREGDPGIGRVPEPAAVWCATEEPGGVQEEAPGQEDPEGQSVKTWEGHVACADLEGEEIVGKGGGHRHDHQEDHGHAVHGEDLVVGVGPEDRAIRGGQLQAHEQSFDASDQEEEQCRPPVEDADFLVVDGGDPVAPATTTSWPGVDAERAVVVAVAGGEFQSRGHGLGHQSTSEAAIISSGGVSPRVWR